MATITKQQLRNDVLVALGVMAAGEAADAADAALVEARIDAQFELLDNEGVIIFPTTAIPLWASVPLAKYIAGGLVDEFGVPAARLQTLIANMQWGLDELHRQVDKRFEPAPVTAEYL